MTTELGERTSELERRADERQREATAATILAALIVARAIRETHEPPSSSDVLERMVDNSVGIADALRKALRP